MTRLTLCDLFIRASSIDDNYNSVVLVSHGGVGHTDSESAQYVLTRKNSHIILVLLTGFELGSLMS